MLDSNFGYININKPAGPTSHDIVDRLRRITGIKKIGHAGTLDPFARGVLILGISREATKNISKFVKLDKEYVARIYLGAVSSTYDRTGEIIRRKHSELKLDAVNKILRGFMGKQKQIPPMFSAKKIKGKRLYKLARQGKEIEREPENIEIFSIKTVSFAWPVLEIKVKCSSGTYIRSLTHDIGEKLGCGAYLEELIRTAIGDYKIIDSVSLNSLNTDNWQSFLMK
ncbi:tRNA pseudouridine(55) synthase TruB [Candidatus Falkowbacteria bacterium]|nr:MAG: tRNA pseudouridine(55) synthase TruB [Candidatus Falkowbacteria bacterium]